MMPARIRCTIERSINVDSLQHHHESGCSVTNATSERGSAAHAQQPAFGIATAFCSCEHAAVRPSA
jgi:hypothetical protein